MKVHFFSPYIQLAPNRTVKELFSDCGNNVGNLLFINAAYKQIKFTEATFGYILDAAKINAEYDLVVIPAANWVNSGLDLGGFYEQLKNIKIKVIVLGIGAQSGDKSVIPSLPRGSRLFLDFVSENSSFISTRGKFTTEVLNYYGYNNCVTTGCPSIFLNCSPEPQRMDNTFTYDNDRVVLQGTRHNIPNHDFYQSGQHARHRQFIRYALTGNYEYIIQSELEEIYYSLGRINNQEILKKVNESLEKYYEKPINSGLADYLSRKHHFFYSIEEWKSFLQTQSLVVTTRIHGAIMALHSSTPGILLWHDSRTQEIADHAALPNMSFEEYDLLKGPDQVIEKINYDAYSARYPIIYEIYKRFLESNRIPHNLN